jgi:hypothetical protein
MDCPAQTGLYLVNSDNQDVRPNRNHAGEQEDCYALVHDHTLEPRCHSGFSRRREKTGVEEPDRAAKKNGMTIRELVCKERRNVFLAVLLAGYLLYVNE